MKKLERVFTELEFEVHTYHDLTKKEVESTLQKYENCNMDDCEMFGLALLTHGDAQGTFIKMCDAKITIRNCFCEG